MIELGSQAILIAWLIAGYSIAMALAGAWMRRRDFVASAENGALAVWAMVVIATAILLHALVTRDFRIEYVAAYSSSKLPLYYTVVALWGLQKGSLLLWD